MIETVAFGGLKLLVEEFEVKKTASVTAEERVSLVMVEMEEA